MTDITKRRGGRPPVTEAQKAAFLEALAASQHVGRSCEAAGFSSVTAYRLRAADPTFALEWEASMQMIAGRVADAALEEALEGAPVYDAAGKVVGRQRNTAVLRDLMRKHLDIPGANSVNVGVSVGGVHAALGDCGSRRAA